MVLGSALIGCEPGGPDAPRVRVAAAASLGPVLETLGPQIERELGVGLELNLAGSGTLTRQVIEGAPADVVLLAHPDWMDTLVAAGRVAAADRVDLWGNTLVVVGRGGPIGLTDLADLADARRFRRVAWGDPDSVPAGRYAEQALRAAGVWENLQRRRVTTGDVRAALAYAQAGEVDAAIVYATDVASMEKGALKILHAVDPA
ncbi:MAG: molybdate ABC transporter substrate-binding protein, partial [Planctomycetota bacterium]